MFRLRTGHNRLSYHLHSKPHIGYSEQCPCSTGSQTTEHLQSCPIYEPLRKGIWPDPTPVAQRLYEAWGTCNVLPPSSRRREFPSDEWDEEEEAVPVSVTLTWLRAIVKLDDWLDNSFLNQDTCSQLIITLCPPPQHLCTSPKSAGSDTALLPEAPWCLQSYSSYSLMSSIEQ